MRTSAVSGRLPARMYAPACVVKRRVELAANANACATANGNTMIDKA